MTCKASLRLTLSLCGTLSLVTSTSVLACRVLVPADQQIARGKFAAIVLVEVRAAVSLSGADPGGQAWEATTTVKRELWGHAEAETIVIGRSGQSSMCDDGVGKPAAGDLWVVYLDAPDRTGAKLTSYPLAIARKADPKLDAMMAEHAQ